MEILHVTAECFPVAKAGGLGDVAGALPKYLNESGHIAKVVMPMYRTKFLYTNEWDLVHEGGQFLGHRFFHYSIIKEKSNKLGFDLYLVDVNGLLDREKIYGYDDDAERFLSFQVAVCDWLHQWKDLPDIVHCHDHHTGLVPFMMKYAYGFPRLAGIPSVFTIHNAQYQGWMGWEKNYLLPPYDRWKGGLLEWNDAINPLASAIKCCDTLTTVSPSYLEELSHNANGLEYLLNSERAKSVGIINGIDTEVWDPATDDMLVEKYDVKNIAAGKAANKKYLIEKFMLDNSKPLFVFIGRLVGEKAADLLPDAIRTAMYQHPDAANFLVLGSGETDIEWRLSNVQNQFKNSVSAYIGYNEGLSHIMYAGADFLLMPSRVEPCGLNQLYSLRYGTVPMVRSTGGLKDTVKDFGEPQGFGLRFDQASVHDIVYSIGRAIDLYNNNKEHLNWMQKYMMGLDHSWAASTAAYIKVYEGLVR